MSTKDNWLLEYDRINQYANEVSADIKTYHSAPRADPNTTKQGAVARRKLVQLTTDIAKLDDQLGVSGPKTTEKELQRRKQLIIGLGNRKDQLAQLMSDGGISVGGADRVDNSGPKQGRAWGKTASPPQETEITKDLDNVGLLRYQQAQMGEHDALLDSLSNSVHKQKEIALTITTELDGQNQILDDLHGHVERTDSRLNATSRKVEDVKAASSDKCMWIFIVLLLLLFIGVMATRQGCMFIKNVERCGN